MFGGTTADRTAVIGTGTDRTIHYDDRAGTYHTWCTDTDYEPVSTALLMAVSSVLGVEPDELDALSERIDPDAVNQLFVHWRETGSRSRETSLSFRFSECLVTVYATGEIVIDPQEQ